jgi:predicted ribosomally synthesized peptide with nif11-like leader
MSKENAMRFFMSMEVNSDLKSQYLAVFSKDELQTLDEAEKDKIFEREILSMAKEAGFEFSIDEFKELQVSSKEGKLSDEELDKVVAGQAHGDFKVTIVCEQLSDNSLLNKYVKNYPNDCPHFQGVFYNTSACCNCKHLDLRT